MEQKTLNDFVNEAFNSPLNDREDDDVLLNTLVMPKPYGRRERLSRSLTNSIEFDKASYEADGGDGWIDARRLPFFEKLQGLDKDLWEQARERSRAVYDRVNAPFVLWMYRKLGGRLS